MTTPAGKRNRRITFQRMRIEEQETGATKTGFEDLTEVWSSYRPLQGSEDEVGDARTAQQEAEFRILYSATTKTITRKDRLVFKGKPFDIIDIQEFGLQEELVIRARLRNADA